MPPSPLTRSDSRLKVVMFFRKSNFSTFWEEVGEVVRIVAGFPGRGADNQAAHPRRMAAIPDQGHVSLRRLPNVSVAGDIHSIYLMNWADVIIDLATSVVFEAVKGRSQYWRPTTFMPGVPHWLNTMPEAELRCRDDVYRQIERFLTHGCDSFYIEEHRQRFVREMIDVGDPDVLSRYVALLEGQVRSKTSQNRDHPHDRAAKLAFA